MAQPDTVVNVAQKLDTFDDLWSPKVIAESNGWHLKVVKANRPVRLAQPR